MSTLRTLREYPFCQADYDVEALYDSSRFPLLLTKVKFFEWLYRIKQWQITVDVQATYRLSSGGGIYSTSLFGSTVNDVTNGRTEEYEMACSVSGTGNGTCINGETVNPPAPLPNVVSNFTTSISIGAQASTSPYGVGSFEYFLRYNSNYLPALYLQVLGDSVQFTLLAGAVASGGVLCEMDGFWLTLSGASAGAYEVLSATGEVLIEPILWWGYDGKYNTGTGGAP